MEDTAPTPIPVDEEAQPIAAPADNTITFKRSHLYAMLLPLAFVVGLAVGYLFWGRSPASAPAAASAAPASAPSGAADGAASSDTSSAVPQDVRRYDVPVDNDHSRGPETAAITIIEFSDFECPYCTKWHGEVWPRLEATYPGQVRLVYRDFPLASIHGNATSAAEAANCAGEQGVYWEYHDLLFSGKYGLGESAYLKYASDLGIDSASLTQCMESGKYAAEVQADYNYAAELGIRSTPTFFVNGIAIVGAQPFEVFQELIDLELAGQLNK
jgi:protein-disulfide isomerase